MPDDRATNMHRITTDPAIMVGKPVVAGTRIPVERVLRHLEENDRADLFAAFPELTEEDVRACLAYEAISAWLDDVDDIRDAKAVIAQGNPPLPLAEVKRSLGPAD